MISLPLNVFYFHDEKCLVIMIRDLLQNTQVNKKTYSEFFILLQNKKNCARRAMTQVQTSSNLKFWSNFTRLSAIHRSSKAFLKICEMSDLMRVSSSLWAADFVEHVYLGDDVSYEQRTSVILVFHVMCKIKSVFMVILQPYCSILICADVLSSKYHPHASFDFLRF